MTKTDFVVKYYDLAVKAGQKFGLNPVVILAQAAVESGWGSSYGATARRNFFGIISSGSKNVYWDGSKSQSSVSKLWFRVYKTDLDSFYDFARLITSQYKAAASVSNDYKVYAAAISQSPYISETNGDNRAGYKSQIISNGAFIEDLILKKKLLPQSKPIQEK